MYGIGLGKSNILPKQRAHEITMEFLADIIREILNEDEDGIVPLVRNSGEVILLDCIEKSAMKRFELGTVFSVGRFAWL